MLSEQRSASRSEDTLDTCLMFTHPEQLARSFLHVLFVVPGFVSATDLRPADVLTSALGNAQAVLEVPCSLSARTLCRC